jgi:hypothetical protein
MLRRDVVSYFTVAIGFFLSAHAQAERCREVSPSQMPVWTISGMWAPRGGELLLVDSYRSTLLRYSESGEALGAVGEPLHSALRAFQPVSGQRLGDGLVLEDGNRFQPLDARLKPLETQDLRAKSAGTLGAIDGLWQSQIVGNDVVAFADINVAPSRWNVAFIRFPVDNPGAFRILGKSLKTTDRERTIFFRTGYPGIAAIGDTAYILSLTGGTILYKNEAGSVELKSLPDFPWKPSPDLTEFIAPADYPKLMHSMEEATMPVGLYAQDRSLYLLSRKPAEKTGLPSSWSLTSIDTVTGRPTGTRELPFQANHVTVIPGPKTWAFVEKGPVEAYGVQGSSKIYLIPNDRLAAPLRGRGPICP